MNSMLKKSSLVALLLASVSMVGSAATFMTPKITMGSATPTAPAVQSEAVVVENLNMGDSRDAGVTTRFETSPVAVNSASTTTDSSAANTTNNVLTLADLGYTGGNPAMSIKVVSTPPLVNLFKFNVPSDSLKAFNEQGVKNLTASMRTEPETLSMNVAHVKGSPNEVYVLEAYMGEEALAKHRAAPHFKEYVEKVGSSLTDRTFMQLKPVIMLEKPGELRYINNPAALVNLVKVTVKDGQNDAFKHIVIPEMKASMYQEPGVILMYGLANPENENEWYFYEIYENEEAYQSHRTEPWFTDYLDKTKEMLVDKEFHSLYADALVNHGNLMYSEQ